MYVMYAGYVGLDITQRFNSAFHELSIELASPCPVVHPDEELNTVQMGTFTEYPNKVLNIGTGVSELPLVLEKLLSRGIRRSSKIQRGCWSARTSRNARTRSIKDMCHVVWKWSLFIDRYLIAIEPTFQSRILLDAAALEEQPGNCLRDRVR